jgi:hypothetical protein
MVIRVGVIRAKYEPEEGILHLSHPEHTTLADPKAVAAFFRQVARLIRRCPQPPYLLVDYANLDIAVDMTREYANQVRAYRGTVKGVYRYNLSSGTAGVLTKVAVLLANKSDANIYGDEASARAGIRCARTPERVQP